MLPISLDEALSSMPCSYLVRVIGRADRARLVQIQDWAARHGLPAHVEDALTQRLAELFPYAVGCKPGQSIKYDSIKVRREPYGAPSFSAPPSLVLLPWAQVEVMTERAAAGLCLWHAGDGVQGVPREWKRHINVARRDESGHDKEPEGLQEWPEDEDAPLPLDKLGPCSYEALQQEVDELQPEVITYPGRVLVARLIQSRPLGQDVADRYAAIARRRWQHYTGSANA